MTITHISEREQALQRENEKMLKTIRVQAAAIEAMQEMKSAPYFEHYQDTLGKLAVAKASAEMWKRKAERVESDSLKMAQETDEIIASMRLDCRRYEYLLHCDFVAHDKYVKDIDPTTHKQNLRRKHDREIAEKKGI